MYFIKDITKTSAIQCENLKGRTFNDLERIIQNGI